MHTANICIEIRECVKWSLTGGENNGKSLTVRPKKWSWSLTGGSRLLEVPTGRLFTGKILVCWIGGHLWEVVAHGASTVFGLPLRFHFRPASSLRKTFDTGPNNTPFFNGTKAFVDSP